MLKAIKKAKLSPCDNQNKDFESKHIKIPLRDISNNLAENINGLGAEQSKDRSISREWACKICTYHNSKRANKCEMCGSSK